MTTTTSAEGKRNRQAGLHFQTAAARALRERGWPAAEMQHRNGVSDIVGVGDLAVECTIEAWPRMPVKLAQASRDAMNRGLTDYCVWKKQLHKASPMDGVVLVPAAQFWSWRRAFEELEAQADPAAEYRRGYDAGYLARDMRAEAAR
jgi:hypothetical protein